MEIPQLYVQVLETCNLPRDIKKGSLQCVLQYETYELRGSFNTNWTWKDEEFLFAVGNHTGDIKVKLLWFASEEPLADTPPTHILGHVSIPLVSLHNEQVHTRWFVLQDGTIADDRNMMKQLKITLQYTYSKGTDLGAKLILDKSKAFMEKIMDPSLNLVLALCKVADISESQKIASALVDFFEYYKKTIVLLKTVIKNEVDATLREGVLFRANSLAMKMVSVYAKSVGRSYLQDTLGPSIREIINDKRSVEVDPSKIKPTDSLEANHQHLMNLSETLLYKIMKSVDQCPMEIRTLCNCFMELVKAKFPNHWTQAVGGFLFLRFFCPACVAPDGYNVIAEPPSEAGRRALVLVTKTLQNLANGVLFTKEDFMTHMNNFIESMKPRLHEYLEKISTIPETMAPTEQISSVVVPPSGALNALTSLHHYLNLYHDKIVSTSNIQNLREVINKFTPPDKSPIQRNYAVNTEQLKKRGALKIVKKELIKKDRKIKPRDVFDFVGLGQLYSNHQEDEIVLNYDAKKGRHSVLNEGINSPISLSNQLLAKIYYLYIKHSYDSTTTLPDGTQQSVMVTNWEEIAASMEFKIFQQEAETLRWVDLTKLSNNDRICFFLNISNTMVLHIHVVAGPPINQFLKNRSTSFFNQYRYNISGYTYSLNMIKHGILRGNPKLSLSGRIFQRADRRNKFIVNKVDPRIHFALSNLTKASPSIRAYHPEELQAAGVHYCQCQIQVDLTKKEVQLPETFNKFAMDFGVEGKSSDDLLIWLFQYMNEKQRMQLVDLMEKKSYHVTYAPYNWEPQVQTEETIKLVDKPIFDTGTQHILVNARGEEIDEKKTTWTRGIRSFSNPEDTLLTLVKGSDIYSMWQSQKQERKPSPPLKPLPTPPSVPQRSQSAFTSSEKHSGVGSEIATLKESLSLLLKNVLIVMNELIEITSPSETTFEKTIMIGQIVSYLNKQIQSSVPLSKFEPNLKMLKARYTDDALTTLRLSLSKSLAILKEKMSLIPQTWATETSKDKLLNLVGSLQNMQGALDFTHSDFQRLKKLLEMNDRLVM